eukprot:SAG11_NODE_6284_length_1344_cov_1.185542_2_plen_118_part_00
MQERNFHIFYMLCYYRHETSPAGEDGEDVSTDDAAEVLGARAYAHLLPAEQYSFLRPGDVEIDSNGQRYRERFAASDIAWLKRVVKSFRASLRYTDDEREQMFALLVGIRAIRPVLP